MPDHRSSLAITVTATAIAWIAWAATVARTDPTVAGPVGFASFHLTLLLAVAGTATVAGVALRRRAADRTHAIRIAIRQGVLIGVAVAIGTFLQSRDLLTWVNVLSLVLALTLLELFIVSLRRGTPDESVDA